MEFIKMRIFKNFSSIILNGLYIYKYLYIRFFEHYSYHILTILLNSFFFNELQKDTKNFLS